ncbi:hypothetical protein J6590_000325 [Homalodisca vitripennis]|nr:hypothetical protein J6590_000325 [Homalodisca vitripennis]
MTREWAEARRLKDALRTAACKTGKRWWGTVILYSQCHQTVTATTINITTACKFDGDMTRKARTGNTAEAVAEAVSGGQPRRTTSRILFCAINAKRSAFTSAGLQTANGKASCPTPPCPGPAPALYNVQSPGSATTIVGNHLFLLPVN